MRKALAVALLSTLAVLGLSASAEAGGPTSVLVTNPGTGQAAALYYTDSRYAELDSLLHNTGAEADPPADPSKGRSFNVAWLAHDVSVWRFDQVYLDLPGGPWVATSNLFAEGPAQERVSWHRVANGKPLVMLLDQLVAGKPAAPAFEPSAPAETPAVPDPGVRTRWFSLTGWRWVAPGLLLGLGLGLVVARRNSRDDEPHQVLVDREPERTHIAG